MYWLKVATVVSMPGVFEIGSPWSLLDSHTFQHDYFSSNIVKM